MGVALHLAVCNMVVFPRVSEEMPYHLSLSTIFLYQTGSVVAKSCNRTEFGQTYGNSRLGADRIYGKGRKRTVFRYRDLVQ